MNNQDYEQKKRECWEEYFKHVVCGTDSHEYWFNKIFDRAYTLGKQEKEEETIPHTTNDDHFADADKMLRLQIATQILSSIVGSPKPIRHPIKHALELADALMAESQKGGVK